MYQGVKDGLKKVHGKRIKLALVMSSPQHENKLLSAGFKKKCYRLQDSNIDFATRTTKFIIKLQRYDLTQSVSG